MSCFNTPHCCKIPVCMYVSWKYWCICGNKPILNLNFWILKYDMIITNFVEIYFVTKRNWIKKKKQQKLNEEIWNEIISGNLFRVAVWGWNIWCFISLPARNRSLEKAMSKQIMIDLYIPYMYRCLKQDYFVIEARYNCLLYIKMIKPYILQHVECASMLKHEEICCMN